MRLKIMNLQLDDHRHQRPELDGLFSLAPTSHQ
jgi:hypothetical protein